jgi:hypothetical protein
MHRTFFFGAGIATALTVVGSAHALTTFVNNPTTNLEDWTAAVGTVTTNIDFDNPDVNATLSYGSCCSVTFGSGPGQGNTFSPPTSTGEGLHPASNFLLLPSPGSNGAYSVTETFVTPVAAAGVETIDYFGPTGIDNPLTLSAYTGPNGTGTLLGTATSAQYNFQANYMYFMGVASSSTDIGSIVFSRNFDNSGDDIGLDNFVSAGLASNVPEASTWAMMLAGFAGLGFAGYRARRRSDRVGPEGSPGSETSRRTIGAI